MILQGCGQTFASVGIQSVSGRAKDADPKLLLERAVHALDGVDETTKGGPIYHGMLTEHRCYAIGADNKAHGLVKPAV